MGLRGEFRREYAQTGEDHAVLFDEALARPGEALGRGPKRYHDVSEDMGPFEIAPGT